MAHPQPPAEQAAEPAALPAQAIPVAPPFVPPPDLPYRQTAYVLNNVEDWRAAYQACLQRGRNRIAQMLNPPAPNRRSDADFQQHYRTTVVANNDSPTGEALLSEWVAGPQPDANHGYKNTPLPALGILRSWQNARALQGNEPFTNADVYFHQYQRAHQAVHGNTALPKLKTLRRQQAASGDTQRVMNYMAWERDCEDPVRGRFGPASDWFAALLGTPNGTAAAHLVLQYGAELRITRITMIEIADGQDLVFTFG
jgi:hypothetical protein